MSLCMRRAMLQLFLEAHFVYLCLVRSLELSFALPPSPILFAFSIAPDSTYVYHMYALLFTCYLPFITYLQYSHVNQFHMPTIITCL